MPLAAGTRLGPYEILAPLGAGGMGEVYRARDTRLDRSVALKVLSPALTADPDLRERFDREARAISQLSHPHICTLHDVGEQGGTAFLVMELLGGETLAARLAKGALPLDEALTIAIQIAAALDAAHRRGIVHRDLTPGNVMLTPSGAKLLDFGLAKANAPTIAGAGQSVLPTTPANLTVQGAILGTFQYMAPEQLEGREADARSDVFAFGAVLYEMLTGRKAFEAKSQASLIAAIISSDPPPVSRVRAVAPPALDRIVATCLAKDPDDRWQSARDLMRELKWVADGPAPTATPPRARSRRLPWAAVALLGAGLLAAAAFAIGGREKVADAPVTRSSLLPPESTRFERATPPAVSPDGRSVVFAAISDDAKRRLWLRPLDSLTANPLAETEGAIYPFWSPDNKSIGFFADGHMKRINIAGGPPTTLADAAVGRGGTWAPDGTIVFAPTIYGGLYQVASSGGAVRRATRFEAGTPAQKFPWFLPDGRHFLYLFGAGGRDQQSIRIGSLDSSGEERIAVAGVDSGAMYAQGHLLFMRGSTLVARPFDVSRLSSTADEVPVAEHVSNRGPLQSWMFSVSSNGVLAYHSVGVIARRATWLDRTGKSLGTVGEPDELGDLELSPDRRTAAITVNDMASGFNDIWLYDVVRGLRTRFTFGPAPHGNPTWSPDGRVIVFSSNRKGRFDLYRQPADGSGSEELLYADDSLKLPESFSPDGAYLAYGVTSNPQTGADIWILPNPLGAAGGAKPFPFLRTAFNEGNPRFSPDGRWIAYESNESGRLEIYVAPFPGPGGKRQVSTAGGDSPRWRADGQELFYRAADNRLTAATVTVKDGVFEVKNVEPLFGLVLGSYDVTADGRRFLAVVPAAGDTSPPLAVIQNWTGALRPRPQ